MLKNSRFSLIALLALAQFAFGAALLPVSAHAQDDFPEIEFDMEGLEGFGEEDFAANELSDEEAAAVAAVSFGMMIALVIISALSILLTALVAYLMMDALNSVPEDYRQIAPFIPWLLFVPIVNIVIIFLIFIKVPESLSSYLESIGDTSQGDCGKSLGLWGAILYIIGCTFPIGLVMLIISIVKINTAKKVIRDAATA